MTIRNHIISSGSNVISGSNAPDSDIPKRKSKKRFKIKLSTAAIYAGVFLLVLVVVFTSYQPAKESTGVAKASKATQSNSVSVDDVVAANVAATVAQAANLPIANDVANLAISAEVQNEFSESSLASSFKAVLVGSSVAGRSVTSYTVASGDTIEALASRFGISKNTIKWANNLSYDTLFEGQVLQILPIDGVIYEVESGDTIDSIASRYSVDKDRLVLYNDLDLSGLSVGSKIILPNATLPENERPGYIAARTSYVVRSGSDGNRYALGNCTWYAYERRVQLGLGVGSYWGNANTWAISAASTGFLVDHSPASGAVLVDGAGWYGHVAVVESVEANGDIVISEMNNYAYGGWNIVNNRTISAGQASAYQYIH